MQEDSGTRSSLLWEVKRLLTEMDELPICLLMENVPQVHGEGNLENFGKWLLFLESLGYANFYEDCNAKHYGIAQNRNRCFCVSILDRNSAYTFPDPIELDNCIKDYLEENVDEKHYINTDATKRLIDNLIEKGELEPNSDTEGRTEISSELDKPEEINFEEDDANDAEGW